MKSNPIKNKTKQNCSRSSNLEYHPTSLEVKMVGTEGLRKWQYQHSDHFLITEHFAQWWENFSTEVPK